MIPSSPKRKRYEEESQASSTPEGRVDSPNDDDDECLPQHLKDRTQLEAFRIDALLKLEQEREAHEKRKMELEVLEHNVPSLVHEVMMTMNGSGNDGNNLVKLMVGGKLFVTTHRTLNKRENMLKTMLSSGFKIDTDENGCIILDRNPEYFPIILEHIRTGSTNYIGLWEEVNNESIQHLKLLLEEADFFGTSKLKSRLQTLITEYEEILEKLSKQKKSLKNQSNPSSCMASNQTERDEEWVGKFARLTLNEKEFIEKYVQQKEEQLAKEKEQIKERDNNIDKSTITFNVRGVKFSICINKLLIYTGSIFYELLKQVKDLSQDIFIDRDPEIFAVIFEYLQSGIFKSMPKDFSKRKLVYKESKEFKLQGLTKYLNPLRFPIEEIGEKNLKIKQEEDFIRKLFATDRDNPLLNDPLIHLVPVFGKDNKTRTIFTAIVEPPPAVPLLFDFEDPDEVEELIHDHSTVSPPPVPEICESREQFFQQFNSFTSGLFKDCCWDNMFCAGGVVGFDGTQVYCLPRAIQAISTRCNIVDPERQSTTYEVRLVKYSLRGFRIGVPGYDPKKICNPKLLGKSSLFSTSRRVKHNIQDISGLARILLIRQAYKYPKNTKTALRLIGGGSNIDKSVSLVNPSKNHDYSQISITRRRWNKFLTARFIYQRLKERAQVLLDYHETKVFFECSLNDVHEILNTKQPQNDLPPHIEWITIEPGRQYIGSFHPTTKNFFIDAYSDPQVSKKPKYRYKWSSVYRSYKNRTVSNPFSDDISVTLEKQYRSYLANKKNATFEMPPGRVFDFSKMTLTVEKQTTSLSRSIIGVKYERRKPKMRAINEYHCEEPFDDESSHPKDSSPTFTLRNRAVKKFVDNSEESTDGESD
ncbi:hypothetical protein C9374_002782 [Naegleria lovaniensis]|uniref:BTB domain-containing protein n=1 Tax=Naegleria lovaniensis TaxID=51637 RepID=A0AA88KMC4_NAELO|nr:uncharacterized protein C9374_002782 [Naegleria lovaniensis]KAG2386336.1 hypothetical protein C9374_002782 [Naegleria lovaniensis]